jgi:L-iditol 2-dehydrogenase
MKAAVYHAPNDIRVEQVPIPKIQPDQALLRVHSACICGTDLRILHGSHSKYPPGTIRIPGHEVAGDLVEVGTAVTGVPVGLRVLVAPNTGCGHCNLCISGNNNLCKEYDGLGLTIDGAFAEYMLVPSAYIRQGNLIPVVENMDSAEAALIEPFACVLRGQETLHIHPGDVVLVIGAGPIGLMHAMLARYRGASQVIISELIPERARQAAQMNVGRVVNPPNDNLANIIAEYSRGQGADVVIVAAPSPKAQEEALELAAIQGRISYFGGLPKEKPSITFNSNLVHYKELIVTGTTACSSYDCWKAARIINSGSISLAGIIGARYTLDRINEAFKAAENREALKICVDIASSA